MEKIDYPKKRNEAEIQALLWYFLRKRKIDARLQVTAYGLSINDLTGAIERQKTRLDIVVFVNKIAKCIVECKSWSDGYSKTAIYRTNNTKQIKKYKTFFKIPVFVCARMSYVTRTVSLIENVLKE